MSLLTQTALTNENSQKPLAIQQAVITTLVGIIKIELYSKQVPVTITNFIRCIEAGMFNTGRFYRVVRLDNDNGLPKIEVIQGSTNIEFKDFAAIPL